MPESTKELLTVVDKVLLRCWVLGFALLFISVTASLLMRDTIHELHGQMFGLSPGDMDVIWYCWIGLLKICIFTFFLIPWLSIKWVVGKSAS